MNIENLAIQSYCFRKVETNAEVAQKVCELGLSKIEVCAVHADFTDESTFDEVIGTYRDAGVEIVSIGVQGFKNDKENEEKFFKFAQKAGARVISANFSPDTVPDCLRTAEALADQYDINLGIHNHGGRHWLGPAQALKMIFNQTSPRVGLMLDTAWALDSREDPLKMVESFSDRLYGLHIKDFVFDPAGKPEDVVVGTGNLKLPELFSALDNMNFSGPAILEYEGDPENPMPALLECVEMIKKECNHG